jgi:hypothetical protein
MNQEQIAKIKKFKQKDNKQIPEASCFISSVCMAISYFAANRDDMDDNFDSHLVDQILANEVENKKWLTGKFGDTYKNYRPHEVGEFWVKFIPEQVKGLAAKVLDKDLKKFEKILQDRPLILATFLTKAGHMVLATSYKDNFFKIIDPYEKWDKVNADKVVWALDIYEV